jgi:hypothetical protein
MRRTPGGSSRKLETGMEMPDRCQMVRSRFCGPFWVSRVTGLEVNLIELPRPGISLNHAYIRLAQAVGDLAGESDVDR